MGSVFGKKDGRSPVEAAIDCLEQIALPKELCAIVREYAKDFEGAHHASLGLKSETVLVEALPNSKLASSHHNGTILIWDVAKAKIVRKLKGHTHPVTKFSAVGDMLASLAACDDVVRVWNAEAGECKARIRTPYADNIALFTDGRLAIDVNGMISVWDGAKETCQVVIDASWITACAPWGTAIVTGAHDGILKIYKDDEVRVFQDDKSWIVCFAILSEDLIAVGCEDCRVRVWSLTTGAVVHVFNKHTGKVESVVAFQDKVASCSRFEICIWSLHGDDIMTIKQGSTCLAVVGTWLVAGGKNPLRVYE